MTPELLFSLAAKNSVNLPVSAHPAFASPSALLARYESFTSLDDFLQLYYVGMSVLQHATDFEALAWDYFQRAKTANVVHAEVFFDPQAHTSRGIAYTTVVKGFLAACYRAESELGISTKLIMCFLRHLPAAEAMSTYQTAKSDLLDGTLAGIGLDSSEAGFPAELFEDVYAAAKADGVKRTAHAGEEAGPESVKAALVSLDVQRIDHGRAIAHDPVLMREIAGREILVTMCPISNLKLKGVSEIADMPVRDFLDAGVRFSINSDDPSYFGGYILENYCAVQEAFDLKVEDWSWIARGAIQGSWCEDSRKKEMLNSLEGVLKEFSGSR